MPTWMSLFLLAGCGGKDTAEEGPEGTAEAPPYIADEDTTDVPDVRPKDLSSAIEEAIAAMMELRSAPLVAAYSSAVAGGDEECPTWAQGSEYWFDSCTSEDGTRFEGVGALTEYEDFTQGDYTYSGSQLYTVGSIVTPEGHTFKGSGGSADLWGTSTGGELIQYVSFEGDFSWDGPGAAGTWLESGHSPWLTMWATTAPSGWRTLVVDGTLTGITEASAVVFHEVTVMSGDFGDTCVPEPSGAISIRDLEGNWLELEFDGTGGEDWPPPEAACDGCAQGWYRGIDVGQICPDVDRLRDWEGPYPWH